MRDEGEVCGERVEIMCAFGAYEQHLLLLVFSRC